MRKRHPLERIAEALAAEWLATAAVLREHHALGAASSYERCAAQVRERIQEYLDELIDAEQGGEESGYSERHIRRLIDEGTLPNKGTPGRPRVLRRHLPLKPGSMVDPPIPARADQRIPTPSEIVQQVLSRKYDAARQVAEEE
jgi:hypothetical protein